MIYLYTVVVSGDILKNTMEGRKKERKSSVI